MSFSKTHLNLSPMITLDHLGEAYVLSFHISYIEDNACFKFGKGGGGGGGEGGCVCVCVCVVCPFVLKFFQLQLSCF